MCHVSVDAGEALGIAGGEFSQPKQPIALALHGSPGVLVKPLVGALVVAVLRVPDEYDAEGEESPKDAVDDPPGRAHLGSDLAHVLMLPVWAAESVVEAAVVDGARRVREVRLAPPATRARSHVAADATEDREGDAEAHLVPPH
jgi:hypothetical protein